MLQVICNERLNWNGGGNKDESNTELQNQYRTKA